MHELSRRAAPEIKPEGVDAIDSIEEEEDNNVVPVMMNSLKDMVLSHLVPGLIDLREAVNEQVTIIYLLTALYS